MKKILIVDDSATAKIIKKPVTTEKVRQGIENETAPLYPIGVTLSDFLGGVDKPCLSVYGDQQRYKSYRR